MRINRQFLAVIALGGFAAAAVAANAGSAMRNGEHAPYDWDKQVSERSRAEVQAEAVEAQRLGLISHSEYSTREATAAELELIRLAGLRARVAEDRLAGK